MPSILVNLGSSALVSLLFVLPLMVMEVVNRRGFNEGFPVFLFFVIWLNLFAFILILLPILRSLRPGRPAAADGIPGRGEALFTDPKSSSAIAFLLILVPILLPLMAAAGWSSIDRLFNGPNPEVLYLPGMFLAIAVMLLPITAGVIAGGPIAQTLRAGGKLFAHPANLVIVTFLLVTFAYGLSTLVIDQWPCFIGVPNCD